MTERIGRALPPPSGRPPVMNIARRDVAGPERLQAIVRAHWQQENGLHYRRDVTLREDATRMKSWLAARALAILNNPTLALLTRTGYASLP